jgi:hypothetical protein
MKRGQGDRIPVPTKEEIDEAILRDHEIVAVSVKQIALMTYMKFAFHNGDTSTVSLGIGTLGGFRVFEALKILFPEHGTTPASGVVVHRSETGLEIQSGHMSG